MSEGDRMMSVKKKLLLAAVLLLDTAKPADGPKTEKKQRPTVHAGLDDAAAKKKKKRA